MASKTSRIAVLALGAILLPWPFAPWVRAQVKELPLEKRGGPSPLDRLDPERIPPIERFDWHPKETVAVLGEHRGRQGSLATAVAYSPDGKQVASGGSDGLIRLWDRATMRLQEVLGASAITALAYFPNGTMLASAGADGNVRLWKLGRPKSQLAHTLPGTSGAFFGMAISPDNKIVAAGGVDTALYMWTFDDKGELRNLPTHRVHGGTIAALAFSPDGKTLASGSHDLTIRLWRQEKGRWTVKHVLKGHAKEIRTLAFSPSGKTLASAGDEGIIRLWNMSQNPPRLSAAQSSRGGTILHLAFGPKGSNVLATAQTDYTARLWTVGSGLRERAVVAGHESTVNYVAFPPGKGRVTELATASSDWTVRLWDITNARPVDRTVGKPPRGHLSHVYAVNFAPDSRWLASCAADQGLMLWDMAGSEPKERYHLKKDTVIAYDLAIAPDGKAIAYGGSETSARLWDPEKKWQLRRFSDHPSVISRVVFSSDGRFVVTSSSKDALLFDAATGQLVHKFAGHKASVNDVAISLDGKYVLTGAGNYLVQDGKIVYKDGKALFDDCTVRLWDRETGKELYIFKDQDVPIYSVAFSADSRRIFYGTYDAKLRQFDITSAPRQLPAIKGSAGVVYTVTTSADGTLMATVGLDGKIILWDQNTLKRLREWTMSEVVYRVRFAPDSRHLAIHMGTGVILVVRVRGGEKAKG
jgi:WD40 repeat protein